MKLYKRLTEDKLPGGLGDGKSLDEFDPEQVAAGLEDETEEHGSEAADEVVADHLTKDPEYYSESILSKL